MRRFLQLLLRILGVGIIIAVLWFAANDNLVLQKGEWLHLASFNVIALGLVGVLLASQQIERIVGAIKNLVVDSPSRYQSQYDLVQSQLVHMCESYYAEGASGLRKFQSANDIPVVWKNILAQMDAHIPIMDIEELLKFEAKQVDRELQSRIDIFAGLVSLAPSLGMLGTVMGLVKLLSELQDVSALGANMALALMTTLYGIGFSVIIFSPLVSRLENLKEAKLRSYFQALFWLRLVENRKPAFYCEPKLLFSEGNLK